ncbi:uncharacterized protein VTP21DRAFT_1495 [Calcarisporiella thermophila]|uniref:uncharacterized protein n=1 Tax=Calcarisporiella thermophila TaxID=911321 RepID=UPI003744B024
MRKFKNTHYLRNFLTHQRLLYSTKANRLISITQHVRRPWHGWKPLSVVVSTHNTQIIHPTSNEQGPFFKRWRVKEGISAAFLPKNYQTSVTPEYWGFTRWQFIQNVTGALTGVLSTQSLLYAIGLGVGSIPLAATLNWVIRDGLGQLGGVIYASFISDRFDSEPKRYRFHASIAMQLASLLEMLTPLWPGAFLPLASISNIAKNMAWIASSATRAQMHKSFMLRDNLGDITGKAGSQSTAAGLIGTGFGILISAAITTTSSLPIFCHSAFTSQPLTGLFTAFLPFSVLTLYANYKSSLYVITPTLNITRAELVFWQVLTHFSPTKRVLNAKEMEQIIPEPREIAMTEPFIKSFRTPFPVPIRVQPPLDITPSVSELTSILLQQTFSEPEHYYIHSTSHEVRIWYDDHASSSDLVKGFFHACVIRVWGCRNNCEEQMKELHRWVNSVYPMIEHGLVVRKWDLYTLFLIENEQGRLLVKEL